MCINDNINNLIFEFESPIKQFDDKIFLNKILFFIQTKLPSIINCIRFSILARNTGFSLFLSTIATVVSIIFNTSISFLLFILSASLLVKCHALSVNETFIAAKLDEIIEKFNILMKFASSKYDIYNDHRYVDISKNYNKRFYDIRNNFGFIDQHNISDASKEFGKATVDSILDIVILIKSKLNVDISEIILNDINRIIELCGHAKKYFDDLNQN